MYRITRTLFLCLIHTHTHTQSPQKRHRTMEQKRKEKKKHIHVCCIAAAMKFRCEYGWWIGCQYAHAFKNIRRQTSRWYAEKKFHLCLFIRLAVNANSNANANVKCQSENWVQKQADSSSCADCRCFLLRLWTRCRMFSSLLLLWKFDWTFNKNNIFALTLDGSGYLHSHCYRWVRKVCSQRLSQVIVWTLFLSFRLFLFHLLYISCLKSPTPDLSICLRMNVWC